MSTQNKKIKKPIVKESEEFLEEESNKKAIIVLCLGIVLVIGLIIGTITYLNNDEKKEDETDNNSKTEEKETEKEKKKEDLVVEDEEESQIQNIVYTYNNTKPSVAQYKVEYYNGENLIKNMTVDNGSNIDNLNLTLTNKVLKYWYYLDSSNNEVIFNFNSDTVTSDLKLYAKVVDLYKVEFKNIEGNDITDSQIIEDGKYLIVLDEEDLVKETNGVFTKVFKWYTDTSYTNEFNLATPITENKVLYGKYENVYRVRFYIEDSEDFAHYDGEYIDKYVKNNEKVEKIGEISFNTFYAYSWSIFKNNLVELTDFDFNTPITENTILVADFGYKLTYNTNGGNEIENIILAPASSLVEPTIPTKDGYKFKKWTYNSPTDVDFASDRIGGNITITAVWDAAVTFETNGGSKVDPIIPGLDKKIVEPVDPIKTGYTFVGWYYDSELTIPVDFTTDMFEVPEVLYAKWTANTITITYDLNNGVNSADEGANKTQQAKTNETIDLFDGSTYTKPNAELDGWSKTSNGEVEYNLGEEITMPNTNTTLYAKWTNIHELTINYNGGMKGEETSTILERREGEKIGSISIEGVETLGGRPFKEFNTSADGTGTTVTSDTLMFNANTTIYIIWEIVEN